MFLEAITYGVCACLKNGENNRKKRAGRKYSTYYETIISTEGKKSRSTILVLVFFAITGAIKYVDYPSSVSCELGAM